MSSFRWLAYLMGLVVVACSPAPDSGSVSDAEADAGSARPAGQIDHAITDDKQAQGALMLTYVEQEPGIEPYVNRVIITADFLRMDDGSDQTDFTLFDRRAKVIYSVSHDDRTALELHEQNSEIESPIKLELDEKKIDMVDAPMIDGKTPQHYRLMVNDQLCRDTIVVPGLHTEAVQAMREFRQVLASVHRGNIPNTPVDMQDPCFLADDVFWHKRSLKFGFPIKEWTPTGFSRSLVDYKYNAPIGEDIFEIPAGYLRKTSSAGQEVDA
ncbi:MAG TPA: hypothetical protein ENI64_10525 [Gammaproteobacteria bacterium]|nr:hypothetical protein [Gammaproteobacteria bacterium]